MKNILHEDHILLNLSSKSKEDAIKEVGEVLLQKGYVAEGYTQGMLEREQSFTTYLEHGVAIPHGTNETKHLVKKTSIVVLQYPDGIDFSDENKAYVLVGIAALGDDHLDILAKLADILCDEQQAARFVKSQTSEEILSFFKE